MVNEGLGAPAVLLDCWSKLQDVRDFPGQPERRREQLGAAKAPAAGVRLRHGLYDCGGRRMPVRIVVIALKTAGYAAL